MISTLSQAFFRFKKLSLSFLVINLLVSLVEMAGLITTLSLLRHFQGNDSSRESVSLVVLNVDLSSLSFTHLLVLVTTLQLLQSFGPWGKGLLMSQLRYRLILWWSDDVLSSFFHARWDTVSQYKPMQLSHLMAYDLEKMGDIFFLCLRFISTFFIFATYTGFLYYTFHTEVFWVITALTIMLWFIKKALPNPRASGQMLREKSEDLDRSLNHFFDSYKQICIKGTSAISTMQQDVRAHEQAWRNAFTLLLKSQMIQRVATIAITSGLLFYAVHVAQIGLDHLFMVAYLFYRLNPIAQQCLNDVQEWKQSSSSFTRANEILSHLKSAPKKNGTKILLGNIQTVECQNVAYAYPTQKKTLLNHFDLKVQQGQVALITGHNGTGKTTLADLICGFLEPTQGQITLNGTNLQELSLTSYIEEICYLPQDPHVMLGSLRENLRYQNSANVSLLEETIKEHPLAHWLEHFPEGLDQTLREDEPTLSGGMVKKINLLSAILSQKSLIILDEPTEHLDQTSRTELIQYLKEHKDQACWIILSHDPHFANMADLTYSMNKT